MAAPRPTNRRPRDQPPSLAPVCQHRHPAPGCRFQVSFSVFQVVPPCSLSHSSTHFSLPAWSRYVLFLYHYLPLTPLAARERHHLRSPPGFPAMPRPTNCRPSVQPRVWHWVASTDLQLQDTNSRFCYLTRHQDDGFSSHFWHRYASSSLRLQHICFTSPKRDLGHRTASALRLLRHHQAASNPSMLQQAPSTGYPGQTIANPNPSFMGLGHPTFSLATATPPAFIPAPKPSQLSRGTDTKLYH